MGALTVDDSYTLSFDARWVSGKPRVIFQTLDHAFGTSFVLPIPENLGTPGAVNSTRLGAPAPTVTGVRPQPGGARTDDPGEGQRARRFGGCAQLGRARPPPRQQHRQQPVGSHPDER